MASLVDHMLTVRLPGELETQPIADLATYRLVLTELFDLHLAPEELARLGLFEEAIA